ncbi:GNAT family N-acetyltransferase [Streptomyces sp. TLI_171]|uniref:GNAT family N-acetyltransferase n=1 Tax=Streptomyces sp. TLI_171 TaxID=1938859 RepID=UPI000C19FEBB|nr:GNAT family N-acetyltransferase [Streptomyces sp. TLI_171]RKE23183.1 acetyltransferase (GNAT) family protein [Streptomyces sp. TLI_171]
MEHVVRAVAAEDWRRVKELRLAALRDPVAGIAFLETYASAVAQPDSFWQERAAGARGEMTARQFVAERTDGGGWDGAITVLIERAGRPGVLGGPNEVDQAHLVGVYVRPEQRGSGLARALFETAIAFAHRFDAPSVDRVRLHVHQDNHRAEAFYRKLGFVRTGHSVPVPGDESAREHELVLAGFPARTEVGRHGDGDGDG